MARLSEVSSVYIPLAPPPSIPWVRCAIQAAFMLFWLKGLLH